MRKIKYIVVHHNGHAGRDISHITRSHRARGFRTCGYHYVIKENGVIQRGRPEAQVGAHVKGLNASSIGICLIGNGNKARFNGDQRLALEFKLGELVEAYPGAKVIGHREVNRYLPKRYRTRKTCPGKFLLMDNVRQWVPGLEADDDA